MYMCNIEIPYQTSFSICSNDIDLLRKLKKYYGEYVVFDKTKHENMIVVNRDKNHYTVQSGNVFINTSKPFHAIHSVMFYITKFSNNVCVLHGAAVEYNHQAYLFIASTNSGKSTLVSYLERNGLRYITDDKIVIEKNSIKILPICIPIHLRPQGYQVLNSYGFAPVNFDAIDEGENSRYVYMPNNLSTAPLKIQKLFFICRNLEENSVIPIEPSLSFDKLLESSASINQVTPEYVAFVQKLSLFPAFILKYKDFPFVLRSIEND